MEYSKVVPYLYEIIEHIVKILTTSILGQVIGHRRNVNHLEGKTHPLWRK